MIAQCLLETAMVIIKTEKLVKRFKDLTAVDGVSLEIDEGECFGLLGPNGAGKTSLIRMITAVSPYTSGRIWVLGKELNSHAREIKAALGIVPQLDNLDPDLTVLQNLLIFARYFDIPRAEARRRAMELLKLLELQHKLNSNIRELSGGMKRRLLIARGLINNPKILILDEPTTGLDPQSKYLVWSKLAEFKAQGVTQLLSTQNMDEAAVLCDRVAIMYQGKVLTLDAPRQLIAKHVGEVGEIEVNAADRDRVKRELESLGVEYEDAGFRIYIFHMDSREAVGEIAQGKLRRRPGTLEDVFFRLTGRSLSE